VIGVKGLAFGSTVNKIDDVVRVLALMCLVAIYSSILVRLGVLL
jgi:hypothetical protein